MPLFLTAPAPAACPAAVRRRPGATPSGHPLGAAIALAIPFALVSAAALAPAAVAAQGVASPAPAAPAAPSPEPSSPGAPTPEPSTPAPPASPGATRLAPVQVQGGRLTDTEERRQSTAAKIVIGREEIDRFGDATLGEVLRRLPGVTVPGPAGRGGTPRMRGLGGGYTQFLIDGQRAPIGFNVEDVSPDQIERIEIVRAPTAETGARAIGGTINIITREGFRVRLNDLRLGLETQSGRVSPNLSWTWNQPRGDLIANVSASVFERRRLFASVTDTTDTDLGSGLAVREQRSTSQNEELRDGLNLTSRLQWRRDNGDLLLITPSLFHIQGSNERRFTLDQPLGTDPLPYSSALAQQSNRFTNGRLNGQWRQRFGDGLRAELNGGGGSWLATFANQRNEFDGAGARLRTFDDSGRITEQSLNLTGKLSKLIEGNHSVLVGAEVEGSRRVEERTTLQDGQPLLADFGDDLTASSLRLALYGQNEWEINPNWSAYVGLRWEGIQTRGTAPDGSQPSNTSSVLTPLLHALWKPVAGGRDQVRFSLTRSYRSPTLQNLVARPSLSNRFPVSGPNDPTSPDRAGNPDLRPELATGLDIAIERYLPEGGVLSANLFNRRLSNYIRSVTTLEAVSWSPVPRYVSRSQNIGGAWTQGLELEARFRLDQWVSGAPPTEMRTNLSLFRSRVDRVPGPDNRLSAQPPGTLNIGADQRLRGLPLTLGTTIAWTPGYTTRVSEAEFGEVGVRRQWDAYALWKFSPTTQLRLSASNLLARDDQTLDALDALGVREIARTTADTSTSWQLRLEVKL